MAKIDNDVLPFDDSTAACGGCGRVVVRTVEAAANWRLFGWVDADGDFHNAWACSEACALTWRQANLDFMVSTLFGLGPLDKALNFYRLTVEHGQAVTIDKEAGHEPD